MKIEITTYSSSFTQTHFMKDFRNTGLQRTEGQQVTG